MCCEYILLLLVVRRILQGKTKVKGNGKKTCLKINRTQMNIRVLKLNSSTCSEGKVLQYSLLSLLLTHIDQDLFNISEHLRSLSVLVVLYDTQYWVSVTVFFKMMSFRNICTLFLSWCCKLVFSLWVSVYLW